MKATVDKQEIDRMLEIYVSVKDSPRLEAGWHQYSQLDSAGMPYNPPRHDKKDDSAIRKAEMMMYVPEVYKDVKAALEHLEMRHKSGRLYRLALLAKFEMNDRQSYRGPTGNMEPRPYTDELRAQIIGITLEQFRYYREQGYIHLYDCLKLMERRKCA